jgi:hypothetical protein
VGRFSKRSLEGEFLIDHRASPGLDPEMAAWMGLPASSVGKGQTFETGLLTCSHCQCGIVKNPDRARPRGYCSKCDKYICDECEALMAITLECRDYRRRIERMQEQIEKFGSTSPLLIK